MKRGSHKCKRKIFFLIFSLFFLICNWPFYVNFIAIFHIYVTKFVHICGRNYIRGNFYILWSHIRLTLAYMDGSTET